MSETILFHTLFPFADPPRSGSQIRPARMLSAFKKLGYEVEVIAGLRNERIATIHRIKDEIEKGRKFAFVYSESSTMPTTLTEPRRPLYKPFADFQFFKLMRKHGIPVGLFYRDVYWRFPVYQEQVALYKRAVAIPAYWYDWFQYKRLINYLFLPSLAMAKHLPTPWPEDRLYPLPPGCDVSSPTFKRSGSGILNLLYIGGITPPLYDLRKAFNLIQEMTNVCLTVCCRLNEWEQVKTFYEPIPQDRVIVVHAEGSKLDDLYSTADLFLLVREPNPYLEFAMPVKVFEALGHGTPVLTVGDNEAARFIQKENFGWAANSIEHLKAILLRLETNPDEIAEKRLQAVKVRKDHTWMMRAQSVANVLGNGVYAQ